MVSRPSAGNTPTVYNQRLTRHEGGFVRSQEQHRVSDLIGFADSSQRAFTGADSVIFPGYPAIGSVSG